MTALILFFTGLGIGVVYEKTIKEWKTKAVAAANAANEEFKK